MTRIDEEAAPVVPGGPEGPGGAGAPGVAGAPGEACHPIEGETPFGTDLDTDEALEAPAPEPDHARAGLVYGIAAYAWWGFVVAIYLRVLSTRGVPSVELLLHRVVWALPVVLMLLHVRRRWADLARAVTDWRSLRVLIASAALIAVNWFGFIFAVASDRLTEASLGYYINPIFSVVLGMVFLGERLRPAQWAAFALAAGAVVYLTVSVGKPPWIALMLAFSFGFYGLLRKRARADALVGLSVEMMLMFPICLAGLVWLLARGESAFGELPWYLDGFMLLGGVVTLLPLLWFANAARRLRLSTIGFLQYIAPTGQLLLAFFAFGEWHGWAWMWALSAIWLALAILTVESVRHHRRSARAARDGRGGA